MQFSMKQFLTGILNSDSYRLSAYSKGHRSLEAIGGVRPRYVGVTWARAATRIRAGLAAWSAVPVSADDTDLILQSDQSGARVNSRLA